MAVKPLWISPPQFEDSNGDPYSSARLFFYAAGSSTKQNAYTDSTGGTPVSNPCTLNSAGYPAVSGTIVAPWGTVGQTYKIGLAAPGSDDPPASFIWTADNISPINDTSVTIDQWVVGPTPTFVSTTQFTLVGDQTSDFHVGRRVMTTNSGGTVFSRISVSAFTALTTVTVVNDGAGVLDSGLSAVSYGLLSSVDPSTPLLTDAHPIVSGSADKTKLVRLEADGLTTATTRVITMPDFNVDIGINGNSEDSAPILTTDYVATYDASSPSIKKVLGRRMGAGVRATAQASTSGTNIDFGSLPSGITRIEVCFVGVSGSGTSPLLIQIGDAGGVEDSAYSSTARNTGGGATDSTAGFIVQAADVAAQATHGLVTLVLVNAATFTWVAAGGTYLTATTYTGCAGSKSLSAELTQIRITHVNGSDTFDAGSINIAYWG
jgi:hypothetical protein